MKKSKGLSLKTTSALIIIIFLFGVGMSAFFFGMYKIALVQTFDIKINVENARVVGFSADPYLDFGTIPGSGGTAQRTINMHNAFDFPVKVNIVTKGEATPYMQFEDNNFILQPDEARTVTAYAVIPGGFNRNATFRGTAKVIYFRN